MLEAVSNTCLMYIPGNVTLLFYCVCIVYLVLP
jgi:hypothetical protein